MTNKALRDNGCKVLSVEFSAELGSSLAPFFKSIFLKTWLIITGATMNNSTEMISVFQGTMMLDKPSNNATIGAKANNMMASLMAT